MSPQPSHHRLGSAEDSSNLNALADHRDSDQHDGHTLLNTPIQSARTTRMSTTSAQPIDGPEQELGPRPVTGTASSPRPIQTVWSRLFHLADPTLPDAAALEQRMQDARHAIAVLAGDTALCDAPSEDEIRADIDLAVWTRAQYRGQRKKELRAEIAARDHDRKTATSISRYDNHYRRWSDRARAAQRRATNPHALLAMTHRQAVWSSWALRAVVLVGLFWSAVNVGRNLMPEGTHVGAVWRLQWVLGFGVEAMISVPIMVIMVQATTAARLGQDGERTRVVAFEAGLLMTTVMLNAGPHLADRQFGRAAEYGLVPVMVAVLIWLHARVSTNYGRLIAGIPLPDDDGGQHAPAISATTAPVTHLAVPFDSRNAGQVAVADRSSDRGHDGPAPGRVRRAAARPVAEPAALDAGEQLRNFAIEMVRQRMSTKSVEEITAILGMAAHRTSNGIAEEMSKLTGTKWSRSTVDRILDRAQLLHARQQANLNSVIMPTAQPA